MSEQNNAILKNSPVNNGDIARLLSRSADLTEIGLGWIFQR